MRHIAQSACSRQGRQNGRKTKGEDQGTIRLPTHQCDLESVVGSVDDGGCGHGHFQREEESKQREQQGTQSKTRN